MAISSVKSLGELFFEEKIDITLISFSIFFFIIIINFHKELDFNESIFKELVFTKSRIKALK